MAQSNISMSSKAGYSMFWSCMWDNKNLYSRYHKEDIFLKFFIKLAFNDNISIGTISFKNKKKQIYKKYTQFLDINNKDLYKYFLKTNKINFCQSKVWILRYQRWVIIYTFIFINNFSNTGLANLVVDFENNYKNNFFYIYKNFLKNSKKNKKLIKNTKNNLFF